MDILPFQLHQMPVKVDAQLSSTVYSSLGIAGPRHLVPGVPQRGTDPRQQFSAPKRLCDIVIRPQIEGLDLIPLPGPGRDYHNGRCTPAPNAADDVHPIHIRQSQIQQDQVRTIGVQHLTGLCSRIGLDHVITIGREHGPQKVADALLILDHQYFILYERHAAAPPLVGE